MACFGGTWIFCGRYRIHLGREKQVGIQKVALVFKERRELRKKFRIGDDG